MSRNTTRVPARIFMGLLLVVHAGLALWGVLGVLDRLGVTLVPLQNALFSVTVQWAHWAAILTGGFVFLTGYLTRWRWTPLAMTGAYLFMGGMCVIETFGFLTHSTRFIDMMLEFVTYFVILTFLFRSGLARERFGRTLANSST